MGLPTWQEMGLMDSRIKNNLRLRELVGQSGLTQLSALKLFNRGLGPAAYSESAWKAFLADSQSARFRPLSDELLVHAQKVFTKAIK